MNVAAAERIFQDGTDSPVIGLRAVLLPFYFVQLANFMAEKPEPDESAWAELRDAQLFTLRVLPHTGMAVIIDIGEAKDIHPRNKYDVGKRLARWALKNQYGKELEASGPLYRSM